MKGALKAFSDNIDPWDLAFIKFAPSSFIEDPSTDLGLELTNQYPHPHPAPDFANEVYVPSSSSARDEMNLPRDSNKQHYPPVIEPLLGNSKI